MIPDYQTLMRPVLLCAADGEVRIGEVLDNQEAALDPTKIATSSQAAQWWSEWVKAAPALLGVVIGAALTVAHGAIQRHWRRTDRARELTISRGEELLDLCKQLHEWDDAARKVVFTGESQGFIPTQAPMFRIAAIVELYFTELSQQAQSLNNVTGDYRHHLRGIAMFVHGGGQLSDAKRRALHEEQDRFEQTLRTFLLAARTLIGKLINDERAKLPLTGAGDP